jgi:hypothetical protein
VTPPPEPPELPRSPGQAGAPGAAGGEAASREGEEYDAAWRLVREAVLGACAPWASAGRASVEERDLDHDFGPELEITPVESRAAEILVSLADQQEASMTCGEVFFWVWAKEPEDLAAKVAAVAADVMTHGMVSAGEGARLLTGTSGHGVGQASWVPWRWRRGKRVFLPYG